MGSEFFKHPAKRLDREFRAMGADRIERTSANVTYRFPDGARRLVPTNITAGKARLILQSMQDRYGATNNDPLGYTERRPGAPVIDLERLSTSEHARERFDLMRRQAGLTFQEVLIALRAPARVLWANQPRCVAVRRGSHRRFDARRRGRARVHPHCPVDLAGALGPEPETREGPGMNRRPNPAIRGYCFACMGWGSTTVRKGTDYEDEIDCLDCGGTGVRLEQKDGP